jgi:hypothetical protein
MIHRMAMSASVNPVLGSHATAPYESRSQLTGIVFILVISIPHLYPHVIPCVISYPLVANRPPIHNGVRGYFGTTTNDEEDIVTTTIMHFRTFNPETMDNETCAPPKLSGRRGYKRVATLGQSSRSPGVNDGEIDQPRVSIHDL